MADFTRLRKFDEIQSRPFGTNTALSNGNQNGAGGTAGSQYRRQEAAYGRALRLLDRQARRGNANSALQAIRTRQDAMDNGYVTGGIRNYDEKNSDVLGRLRSQERGAQDLESGTAANRARAADALLGVEGSQDAAIQDRQMGQPASQGFGTPGNTFASLTQPRTNPLSGTSFVSDVQPPNGQVTPLGASGAADPFDNPDYLQQSTGGPTTQGVTPSAAGATPTRINRLTGKPFGWYAGDPTSTVAPTATMEPDWMQRGRQGIAAFNNISNILRR